MNPLIGEKEYFTTVDQIEYEGPDSKNPLAFNYYKPDKIVAGKPLREHFKFACAYWHSFGNGLSDPFGAPTRPLPWNEGNGAIDRAKHKMDAAFEFMSKLGLEYFCFHDYDLVEEGNSLAESEKRLQTIAEFAQEKMEATGIGVLWGTANLFNHPRYMNGAATNPDFDVLARAAGQVKLALDTTIELNGENYVFWGGREGYMSLLNTDMKRERDHLARFLHTAKDYARNQGFKGNFFVEPKPAEPTKHQYDHDAATVVGFLQEYDLQEDFKINVEVNHAILAGHTFDHELQTAADAGLLGSIDGNRGDHQNGWDTDQFPINIYELTRAMMVLLREGGLQGGGVNFDAKLRRNSTDLEDLFYAHIGGMDAFSRALITAAKILNDSVIPRMRSDRYASFNAGKGKEFEQGTLSLEDLYSHAEETGEPDQTSGQQELYETVINQYL